MQPLRQIITAFAVAAALALPLAFAAPPATAQDQTVYRAHAIAMHGEPKYGPDFPHFDYVNPDAPKGGTIRLSATGNFDTFNPFNAKGTPAPSAGIETLMVSSSDEPFTMYGLLAETIEWPEDRSWIVFHLNPQARWHDGMPVTPEDVVFSLDKLRTEGRPLYRFYYQGITAVEKVGERSVKFTFAEGENRELPLIVGQLPVLPKHYWENRDFTAATLEPPLGSGPYKVARFEPGRFVEHSRVEDYWGEKIPVRLGTNNYGIIRYDYFRDRTIEREALKAGQVDYFEENSAKEWATAFELPVVRANLLIKEQFLNRSSGGMQAFYMNTRREPFTNRKVRQALAYAFDFQWTNRTVYYGQYEHPASFFAPTELASSGLPQGEELEILERYRGRIPEEVFTEPYIPPKTDGSGWPRQNLQTAFDLLAEAGWVVRDMQLVNEDTGAPFRFEFLYVSQAQERVLLPFFHNLKRLGIVVRPRLVDSSQYINRLRSRDFDMMIFNNAQALSPGNEQREYWNSHAADEPSSRNIAGIKDPVVDELIELVISAPSRESLVQRTRALDRVLLWGHYVIPQLIAPFDRIVFWDKFGRPEVTPLNGPSISYWWVDEEKAASLPRRRRNLEGAESAEGR
ncbi:MAG: extracellular solute-binding protein [Kiloniellaceae bacterium]